MSKILTATAAVGAAVALCAVNNAGAFAISGGTPAQTPSSAVHLHVSDPPDNFDCTGALIGPHWVLSASGCNFADLSKYPITIDRGDGTTYNVDAAYNDGNSDFAAFHIAQSVPAPTGPQSDPAANGYIVLPDKSDTPPAVGDTDTVYGWDRSSLNKIDMKITGFQTDPEGTYPVLTAAGCKSGGCLGAGDYGAPFLHNYNGTWKLIGTDWDYPVNDDRVHCTEMSDDIISKRDWIKSTTGI